MNEQKYSVGEIVYVILSKKNIVVPMRIVEEITKKTLDGEQTNYLLQSGSDVTVTVMLTDVDGEIFKTDEEIKAVLIERATTQIAKMVANAVNKVTEWYGVTAQKNGIPVVQPQEIVNTKKRLVKLEDGTVVNINMPDIL